MTINRLLVANRGEIARRVFRTCRDLGIETVAVHSDADARLPFVTEADVAVRLPGNTPAETYLRGDLIVAAALRAGADAVHPGYGFLSENADFARQVIDAGLTWVGPRPESIEQMGSKIAAKKLVAEVGVPVLGELEPTDVIEADLPVLVKASAGGGGRGMRVVRELAELDAAVAQAADEAASAFGDATVFIEPYVERGRHVEVQLLADRDGNTAILGERDCSIQRRHQKVVEEAPAPGLTHDVRKALFRAAGLTAASVHYVGAGTVEFLYDPTSEQFWFLEMNTRLQVEHPVTECVTGIDLVAAQIAIAEGRRTDQVVPSGLRGETPWPRGHAVEARLYAEDPLAGWSPQSGRLTRFEFPGVDAELEVPGSYGVRLDSGFVAGDEVGTHYDAMLAKVVAWAPTREDALRRLAATLAGARIHGVRTNRDLLVDVLRHETVVAGAVGTDFFARHDPAKLAAPAAPAAPAAHEDAVRLSAFAATVALAERERGSRTVQLQIRPGWRNVVSAPQLTRFRRPITDQAPGPEGGDSAPDGVVEVRWYGGRDGYASADLDVEVVAADAGRVVLEHDGTRRTFEVFLADEEADERPGGAGDPSGRAVDVESSLGHVALRRTPRFLDPADQLATGSLLAPMPGTVVAVAVGIGDTVTTGQPVLVLEAMKMQHTVAAPHDGTVTEVAVGPGAQVAAGAVLAVVDPASGTGTPTTEGESA